MFHGGPPHLVGEIKRRTIGTLSFVCAGECTTNSGLYYSVLANNRIILVIIKFYNFVYIELFYHGLILGKTKGLVVDI